MKANRKLSAALAAILGLALTTQISQAASDINYGPTASEAAINNPDGLWMNDWGPAYAGISFDSANPPPTGDTAGAIYVQGNWTGNSGGWDNYNIVVDGNDYYHGGAPVFNGNDYTSIELDIKYDTNSTITPATAAHLDVGIDHFYGNQAITTLSFAPTSTNADGNWHHVSIPISANQTGISSGYAVGFYEWNPDGTTGTMNYWVANVRMVARVVEIPPPTLFPPQSAMSGLNVIAADIVPPNSNVGNNRYQLCTVGDSGYGFVGQNSVTYSWNIKAFPAHTGTTFQQHVFLVSGQPGQYDQSADWNMVNCIFLTVQQDDSGNAFFNFRYKTNEPGGNAMFFNGTDGNSHYTFPAAGAPTQPVASITSPTGAAGTWSVTFDNTTNVTMTGPGGITTNFVFDPAAAAFFADPLSICVGGQPNSTNSGTILVYNSFSATGVASPINDNFSADAALDTNTWKNLSNDTNGCVLNPVGTAYAVSWTLPDLGYSLVSRSNLHSGSWNSTTAVGPIADNGVRVAFVTTNNLPGANSGYFALVKRSFSQLQILLPGETNAPGTSTGKIGTPDPQSSGNVFSFTVLAVDANWYPITGVYDTINFSSTDPGFVPPNPAPLSNGSATFYAEFGTPSTDNGWTVTVSDSTKTNILSNTSSPVSVPQ